MATSQLYQHYLSYFQEGNYLAFGLVARLKGKEGLADLILLIAVLEQLAEKYNHNASVIQRSLDSYSVLGGILNEGILLEVPRQLTNQPLPECLAYEDCLRQERSVAVLKEAAVRKLALQQANHHLCYNWVEFLYDLLEELDSTI